MTTLFDKFSAVMDERQALTGAATDPTNVVVDKMVSATEGVIAGRATILAGTNNYLGLTFEPSCVAAGQHALANEGTGTTGSRMANGNYHSHKALERELAEFYDLPHAMVFSTGYGANLGILTALLQPGDCVLLDADAHASLYDGCKMSGADIYRFKHNDPDSLEARLRRLGDRATRTLIVVEGLYSIIGDCAPLQKFAEIKRRYGAYLLIDEAHSLGIYGDNGRGLVEAQGITEEADFIVGTFSKSLGSTGGFCVSQHEILSLMRYTSRPFIFTASACPSVIATTRAALQVMCDRTELRTQLWKNAHQLYAGLQGLGLSTGPEVSPVVGVRCADQEQAINAWHRLLAAGVYTNLIVPPASPDGSSLLRCSMSAAHTSAQVDAIIAAFEAVLVTN